MERTRGISGALLACLLIGATTVGATAAPSMPPEPGFVVTSYATTSGTPTSLAFGRDTREGAGRKAVRLYVTDGTGGTVLAIDGPGATSTFAEGFRSPLGVLVAANGDVYVADAESARPGPYGTRPYGRVWRVRDTDGDGIGDKQKVVLKDLPNGRHNTNGMAFGPDGLLYVANGNATDDGSEGGEAEVDPWSGSVIRFAPRKKTVSLADLPRSALVAHGWRNVYDLAFSPLDPTKLFVPMNGSDDARKGSTGENPADPDIEDSDDLLFVTDVDDRKTDDFGFPSCFYNEEKQGNLKPYDNPNPDTIEMFGHCPKRTVPRPVSSFGLHPSADGLAFQTTDAWGDDYRNDLFVAEWGSLFGNPTGHKVVRVQLNDAGTKVVEQSDFVDIDLPLDLTFDRAGSMYVADYSGTILKVDQVP
jgi:glucose/arabinose dehydrogenase